MNSKSSPSFASAFRLTWPVMVGYFPMALAFGILFGDIFHSFLAGLWVYAGAAQFLSIKLFHDHQPLSEILFSTFFLNVRHCFYSLHMLGRYSRFPFWIRVYAFFALTDETYAIVANHEGETPQSDAALVWRISLLNHGTWVLGCVSGAIIGSKYALTVRGLDFFLIGLFVVLLVEQLKKMPNYTPTLVAGAIGLLGVLSKNSLWLFWAMLACVVLGLFLFREESADHA